MLSKKNDRPAIKAIILTSLLTLLSACGNSAALESLVSPDPALKKDTQQVSDRVKTQANSDVASPPERDTPDTTASSVDPAVETDSNTEPRPIREKNTANQLPAENSVSNLLLNFPETFPVYPQAELEEIKSSEDENSGMLIWQTTDNSKAVADYYQAELTSNNWDIIKPFTFNPKQKIARAIAVKEDLRVELSLIPLKANKEENKDRTRLSVVYHPLDEEIPKSSIAKWDSPDDVTSARSASSKPEIDADAAEENEQSQSDRTPASDRNQNGTDRLPTETNEPVLDGNSYNSADIDFTDLDEVPSQLQQQIESVAALNILTPYTAKGNVELTKFAPNETITRGEYARWLIAANNRYYDDDPGKKIYVVNQTDQPAFNDVKPNHPDFVAIQSLAEAGLIPSRLTEDSTNLLFRPDAPLIREDLVTWKVPLDTRKSLPKASIEAIEESWGFQDAAKIEPSAIRALYADFQNGDRSNIKRMFGYTTLFQPKKSVTRAEAAASLWYFGFQGDGVTAKEILDSESETSG